MTICNHFFAFVTIDIYQLQFDHSVSLIILKIFSTARKTRIDFEPERKTSMKKFSQKFHETIFYILLGGVPQHSREYFQN